MAFRSPRRRQVLTGFRSAPGSAARRRRRGCPSPSPDPSGPYLAKKVGVRPLLGGEALGTERAHLSVETLYVDCAGLMILYDDLPPDDDSVDVYARGAFHKGVDDVESGSIEGSRATRSRSTRIASPFMPGTSAPTSSAKPLALAPFNVATRAPRRRLTRASPGRRCEGDGLYASSAVHHGILVVIDRYHQGPWRH